MVFKRLIGLAFAAALTFSAVSAQIVVQIRPPRAVSERRMQRPSRNHVWVSGYHNWNGNAYAWSPGRWEQPPRAGNRWVAARWTRHGNGWVLVQGHWR
jgi:hypothetical protein